MKRSNIILCTLLSFLLLPVLVCGVVAIWFNPDIGIHWSLRLFYSSLAFLGWVIACGFLWTFPA